MQAPGRAGRHVAARERPPVCAQTSPIAPWHQRVEDGASG
jgi:hypothetical protein